MKSVKILLLSLLLLSPLSMYPIGLDYQYPLYPYKRDLSQTLTFKIMLRCALENDHHNLDLGAVAKYLQQIDCISRGLPKVVILGGFQQGGHDHTYPWWMPIDSTLYAPGGLKGKDALLWLMNEAKKYNTNCTFHVNPFDAYMDSPMWDMYVKKDLLCRNADGSLVKGDVWWNRQSYFVNMVNEWNAGVTKQRIDAFIEQVPLVKETGVLYFDNETQYPPSLYHYVTKEDQISAIKKAAEYLKTEYGIQLIGEYADTNLYGVCSLGVTWDWWASLNINQMEVAPYIACGGRDGTHDELYGGQIDLTKRRFQVFGASVQLEDTQFQRDPFKVARELSHHTYVYFYLNFTDAQKSADFMQMYYQNNPTVKANMDKYLSFYFGGEDSGITVKDADSYLRYITNGNVLSYSGADAQGNMQQATGANPGEKILHEQVGYQNSWYALNRKMITSYDLLNKAVKEDGEGKTHDETDGDRSVYDNLVNEKKMIDYIDDNVMDSTKKYVFTASVEDGGLTAIMYDNGESGVNQTLKISQSDADKLRLVVCTGDVEIEAGVKFQGIIMAKGTITLRAGAQLESAPLEAARVFQAQMRSYGDGTSIKPQDFFWEGDKYVLGNSSSSGKKDTLNGSDTYSIADCVTYENWKKE